MCNINRPATSLGHQGRLRVFWEGPKFFKQCSIVLTYAQHIFTEGAKKFAGGFLVTSLAICLKSNLQKSNSNASNYSYYIRNTSNFSLILSERNVVSFMYFQVPVDPNVPKMGT